MTAFEYSLIPISVFDILLHDTPYLHVRTKLQNVVGFPRDPRASTTPPPPGASPSRDLRTRVTYNRKKKKLLENHLIRSYIIAAWILN